MRALGWFGIGIAGITFAVRAEAAGALSGIAPDIAQALGPVPQSTVVVASPLASDQPSVKGDELSVKLAALLAGKLGGAARAHGLAAPLSVARAVAGKGGALVYVQVEIARGELRATADLYPVMSNGWDRVRVPLPPPRAHAFARAPIDAEVRTYLPPVLLEHARVDKMKHDQGEVLAAACGDLDGDGANDLVLVSRTRVAWGHLLGGKFVADHAVAWNALSSRGPTPMREPLATAVITPRTRGELGGDLFVGLTDRGGFAVSRDLLGQSTLLGLPVTAGGTLACARPNAALGVFEGALGDCVNEAVLMDTASVVPVTGGPPIARFDAIASVELVGKDGSARPFYALREPSGKLHLRLGEATLAVDGVGAQIAVSDLDQDGVPEVITTMDSGLGGADSQGGRLVGEDVLSVSTWRGGDLKPRLRYAAPAGVRAVCVCPPEERGLPALVAVVGGEVWVAR